MCLLVDLKETKRLLKCENLHFYKRFLVNKNREILESPIFYGGYSEPKRYSIKGATPNRLQNEMFLACSWPADARRLIDTQTIEGGCFHCYAQERANLSGLEKSYKYPDWGHTIIPVQIEPEDIIAFEHKRCAGTHDVAVKAFTITEKVWNNVFK